MIEIRRDRPPDNHGEGFCDKVDRKGRTGFPEGDGPFWDDGVPYCGRCMRFMDKLHAEENQRRRSRP